MARVRVLLEDARTFQIAFLASLLLFGAMARDFSIRPEQVVLTVLTALGVQLAFVGREGLPSALVTSLGLSLLVRADNLLVHPLCAMVAIGSKRLIRFRGKHVWNPANAGVLLAMAVLPGAWTSPGQWGATALLAGWIAALGLVVTFRAVRWDTSLAFLASWIALCFGRVSWLGQRPEVLLHQLETGSMLVFTFFMISDPRTTPNHRAARIVYSAAVALVAFLWQFGLYRPHGPIVALGLLSPLVPLLDILLPATAHRWTAGSRPLGDPDALQPARA